MHGSKVRLQGMENRHCIGPTAIWGLITIANAIVLLLKFKVMPICTDDS